jgi:A/G-specific adenine glycosylase
MTEFTARELTAMRRALIRWSQSNCRELPWRSIGDPYRVWISEVMLQQTTVAAVVPYYKRFLERFPDVATLAAADEADVLRLWEGLGYYSRARNLHRGAQTIVTCFGGTFPRDVAKLQSMPGIGRYTAGAIASFAFDERAPIVEANTLRLDARLMGYVGDPRSSAGRKALWKFAEAILPQEKPGRFNQALMDLGAAICTPSEPDCPNCPLRKWCRALLSGRVAEIPQLARRPDVTQLWSYSVAVRREGRYLLRRCGDGERWAGLWDFPRWERETPPLVERELPEWVQSQTGLRIELGPQIAEFKHGVTRYRITAACFLADRIAGRLTRAHEWAWIAPAEFSRYAFSVTGRKFAERLRMGLW